jgi:hypothetical protein
MSEVTININAVTDAEKSSFSEEECLVLALAGVVAAVVFEEDVIDESALKDCGSFLVVARLIESNPSRVFLPSLVGSCCGVDAPSDSAEDFPFSGVILC